MSEAVTRAEFNELLGLFRDFMAAVADHVHDMPDINGGGETRRPDIYAQEDFDRIRERLASLTPSDPASPLSQGEGEAC